MARTALTVQEITIAGTTPAWSSLANTDGVSFENDGRVYAEVKNTSGSPVNITVVTAGSVAGVAISDPVVSVPATTGVKRIGPFSTRFNQSGGVMHLDNSAFTGVSIGVFRLP